MQMKSVVYEIQVRPSNEAATVLVGTQHGAGVEVCVRLDAIDQGRRWYIKQVLGTRESGPGDVTILALCMQSLDVVQVMIKAMNDVTASAVCSRTTLQFDDIRVSVFVFNLQHFL